MAWTCRLLRDFFHSWRLPGVRRGVGWPASLRIHPGFPQVSTPRIPWCPTDATDRCEPSLGVTKTGELCNTEFFPIEFLRGVYRVYFTERYGEFAYFCSSKHICWLLMFGNFRQKKHNIRMNNWLFEDVIFLWDTWECPMLSSLTVGYLFQKKNWWWCRRQSHRGPELVCMYWCFSTAYINHRDLSRYHHTSLQTVGCLWSIYTSCLVSFAGVHSLTICVVLIYVRWWFELGFYFHPCLGRWSNLTD